MYARAEFELLSPEDGEGVAAERILFQRIIKSSG